MKRIAIILCLLLLTSAYGLTSGETVTNVSLKKAGWQGFRVVNDADGSLSFGFPTNYWNFVDYLWHKSPVKRLRGTLVIQVEVIIKDGDPEFKWDTEEFNVCYEIPAAVHPFLWSHNDSYAEFDRWWPHTVCYNLAGGEATLTIPIQPENWLSVYGKHGDYSPAVTKHFWESMNNVSSVGVTFGGGCFFGHGVYIQGGHVRFRLKSFQLNM